MRELPRVGWRVCAARRPGFGVGVAGVAGVVIVAVLAGCASAPGAPAGGADGPEANPPAGLALVPDAEPQIEPIRIGGPNKPYDALGQSYVPITQDVPFRQRGPASWYGRKFQGRRTSSGELYNMYAMTAAHPTLPIPSYARIRNPANGREVVVRINDRGPFHSERIVDVSYTAALKLDLLRGVREVELERITFDDIRTGAWRHDAAPPATRLAQPATPAPGASTLPTPPSTPPIPAIAAAAGSTSTSPSEPAFALATPAAPSPAAPYGNAALSTASTPTADSDAGVSAASTAIGAVTVAGAAPVADAAPARAGTGAARGFWVQLGAFRQRDGAESFHQRVSADLDWLTPLLAVFSESALYRLQAGPYPSRDDARLAAERIGQALRLVPVIVERR